MNLKSVGIILLVLGSISVTGCKDTTGENVPVVAPLPTDPTTPSPGVVVNSAGFNVKVKTLSEESYFIHKTGDFTKQCSVANDATLLADKDIECLVETEELEGVFMAPKMVVNVPSGLCSYVAYRPYFYFGRDYGAGPTAITVRFDVAGNSVGGVVTGGGGGITGTGTPYCDFNYTGTNPSNCCLGSYNLTTVTNYLSADPQKPQTTSVQSNIAWDGNPGNCIGGFGALAERVVSTGMPVTTIYNTPFGFSNTVDPEGSLILGLGSLYYSNYYSGSAPAAFKLASTYKGNPYYEWTCLDDAFETKARIRVRVREWNSMAQFLLGAAGSPDAVGIEAGWGTSINDFDDWDDVISAGDYFPGLNK